MRSVNRENIVIYYIRICDLFTRRWSHFSGFLVKNRIEKGMLLIESGKIALYDYLNDQQSDNSGSTTEIFNKIDQNVILVKEDV